MPFTLLADSHKRSLNFPLAISCKWRSIQPGDCARAMDGYMNAMAKITATFSLGESARSPGAAMATRRRRRRRRRASRPCFARKVGGENIDAVSGVGRTVCTTVSQLGQGNEGERGRRIQCDDEKVSVRVRPTDDRLLSGSLGSECSEYSVSVSLPAPVAYDKLRR